MAEYKLRGKLVRVDSGKEIFVNGSRTNLKIWKSDNKRYSNIAGQEQKELKGFSLEKALLMRGFL